MRLVVTPTTFSLVTDSGSDNVSVDVRLQSCLVSRFGLYSS